MKVLRWDGKGDIDIRRVRRLLGGYVRHWRKLGRLHGWPDAPVGNTARSPAELVRRFRKMQRQCERQYNWAGRKK